MVRAHGQLRTLLARLCQLIEFTRSGTDRTSASEWRSRRNLDPGRLAATGEIGVAELLYAQW